MSTLALSVPAARPAINPWIIAAAVVVPTFMEVLDTTIANVALKIGDKLLTPPIRCGLLAGTQRARLMKEGVLTEKVIRIDDLASAESIILFNSVRGQFKAQL